MNTILEQISLIGIVPVITIDDVDKAVPLAKALVAGGLPVAEVTFRTAQAAEAIVRIAKEVPEMLVGAGTVLTTDQADRALAAGARFLVSPGFNPKVVRHCLEKGVPIAPGCSSPTDMEAAIELGLEAVKFFPAEQSGGVAYLKAVGAAYTNLHFMPTGGINARNLNEYLSFDKVLACGGSWMVTPDLIAAGDWDTITALSREAVRAMLGFQLSHVGINCPDGVEAERTATAICSMFGFERKESSGSFFCGDAVECMKTQYLGTLGHIAIGVNNVTRAQAYLEAKGVTFNEDTRRVDDAGHTLSIYLAEEFGGFALHLLRK